jgi:phage tail-like protein
MNLSNFELHNSIHFQVMIDDVHYGSFTECVLPDLQLETEDIKEGGQNTYIHKLPVRVNVGTVKLRHGITKDAELLTWYRQILRGDVANATRQVSIVLLDSTGDILATWGFRDAYPVKWTAPSLKAGESAIAIEEIEFAHRGFEIG